MPKFYVFSDVHGFYYELRQALDEAGFDENNPDHIAVGLGDYMDRGRQPSEVMGYLQSLPMKLLVRGNHEQLLEECIDRSYPLSYDWSNGTAETILDLAPNAKTFDVACAVAYEKIKDFIGSMVDYIELKNHILVHSWVPVINKDGLPAHYTKNRKFEFNPNWRNASRKDWEDARWGNPFDMAERGFLPDKTVVFGHWHASAGWTKAEGREEFGPDAKFDPYYGDGFIAIDSCTAYTKKVNVLVIEDELID